MAPIQAPKTHHDRHEHVLDTQPHQSLIQIVLADASCNIALTVLMALSLAQPFCSRQSSELYIQSQVASEHQHLQPHKQIKTEQSSKLKSQLSSFHPERRKKANKQP
jgi:hypothetical protein